MASEGMSSLSCASEKAVRQRRGSTTTLFAGRGLGRRGGMADCGGDGAADSEVFCAARRGGSRRLVAAAAARCAAIF
eukprot:3862017-Prymnesium_polylepis.1